MDDNRDGFYAIPDLHAGSRTNVLGVTDHREFNTEQAYARFNQKPKARLGQDGRTYPIPAEQQGRR